MICNTQKDKACGLPYHHATGHPNESRLCLWAFILLFGVLLHTGAKHKLMKWPRCVSCPALASMGVLFGIRLWQEHSYWPCFVKWYNPALLFPFTPPRPHLTFSTDCIPLTSSTLRHKTHRHSTHTENVKEPCSFHTYQIFTYVSQPVNQSLYWSYVDLTRIRSVWMSQG